jgi:glycosyltransferase EpsF
MIHVLHIVGRMDRAGAETMLMNLYREIDRTRFQFDFAYFTTDRCDYDDEIEALGGRVYHLRGKNSVTRFLALLVLLRKRSWDIVHSHTLFSSALHLTAARLAGVPQRVAHSHNTHDSNSASLPGRLYQRGARWLLARVCTQRVACGVAAAEYIFPGRHDVVVLPNALDIDRFADASSFKLRTELGLREDQLVILQVGRFMPVKNHVRSVLIAHALRNVGVDFQLLLVGTGPGVAEVEETVRQYQLERFVRILGLRADIPELMALADVMLMPSLYEGFPVVLVEAQAAGLPSLVSSAISTEVDLGLGMVRFLDLGAANEDWAENVRSLGVGLVPSIAERRRVLVAAGFSSVAGAKRIEEVYIIK